MKKTILIFFCFAKIALYSPLFSQSHFPLTNINELNGLSDGSVTDIVQDSIGFVWIATKNGLNRYDGHSFKVYNKYNSDLSSNDISDLLVDRKGRLWIGTTGGGLNLYDGFKDKFRVFKNEAGNTQTITSNQVSVIYEDTSNNLIVGTETGLSVMTEDEWIFKSIHIDEGTRNSLKNYSVKSIVEFKDKSLWVGLFGGGLHKLNLEDDSLIPVENENSGTSYSSDFIYCMIPISEQELLLGTGGSGLILFNRDKEVFSPFQLGVKEGPKIIRTVHKDSNDAIWIGSDGEGVVKIESVGGEYIYANSFKENPNIESSLAGNAIYSIFEDKDKNVWMGTAWNGISILENNKNDLKYFHSDFEGDNPLPVLSIYVSDSHIWFGSDGGGLSIYNQETGKILAYFKDSNTDGFGKYIQFIKPGRAGKYWLGTFSDGLILLDTNNGTSKRFFNHPNRHESLSYNDVRDLLEDKFGNIWVATWGGGLCHFDARTEKFRTFRHDEKDPSSISNDNVLRLFPSSDGKIWISTFGGGLNLFDPISEKFEPFRFNENDEYSISDDNVLSLYDDQKGNLWVGTWGNGLCRYSTTEGKFYRYVNTEDATNNTITAVLADDNDDIWMSTKNGIIKYIRASGQFVDFPELSGSFHINSAFKDAHGKMYFGGKQGVLAFQPEKFETNQGEPTIALVDFKLFNKNVSIGENEILASQIAFQEDIVLNHDQTVMTFDFAALQYPFSSNCEFEILMENFDIDWRMIGNQRSATYTNLSPGDYKFKVRVKSNGAEWTEDYAGVHIKILKPYWSTWWAFTLYGMTFTLLLYLFQKYSRTWEKMKNNLKVEQITREKESELHNLKQQFFTNISHEIRTPVTLIIGSINRMLEHQFLDKKYGNALSSIKKNGDHLLQLVNELLDIRRIEVSGMKLHLEPVDLVEYTKEIFLSFENHAANNKIQYRFVSNTENCLILLDQEQMEKAIYNLLSNAFKFTKAGGNIEVNITEKNDCVSISVYDSGPGIPEGQLHNIFKRFYQTNSDENNQQEGYGIGLSIVKDIVNLHGGEVHVNSEIGKGSRFDIRLHKDSHSQPADQEIEKIDFNTSDLKTDQKVEEDKIENTTPVKEEKNAKILVVEDNQDIRNYISNWLQSTSEVIAAENGKVGLEMARKHLPDLVISDVMMPVMDGITFTREMKSAMITSHIPIIILTARTSLVYKKEGYDTGADEYITKPFSEELLISRIEGILRNRERLQSKLQHDQIINPSELSLNTPDQKFMADLIKVIEENIDQSDINANLLSRELGMSHSVIYKKIKAITGQSMVDFVREFKLKRAAQLIGQYGLSVSEACYKVGFSDRRYFTRIFKQKFGHPPSTLVKK